MTRLRGSAVTAIFMFAAAYLVVCLVVRNQYYQLILTLVLVWAIMGVSWNVFSGYSGLVSFGHASFFGLGAYTVTSSKDGWSLRGRYSGAVSDRPANGL